MANRVRSAGRNAPAHVEPDRIYNLDCVQGMKAMASACADLVVTDPPFAIEFKARRTNYHRTPERVIEGYGEVPKSRYLDFTRAWMSEAFRVLKDSGSLYVFSGWNNLKDVLIALDETGFTTVNHIIWKYQFGVVTKRRYVTSHYHCVYACKDDRKRRFFACSRHGKDERIPGGGSARYADIEDVWVIPREYWHGDAKTATKLPSEVIKKILQYSSEEGDLVLDPFLGSGQVAVVARMMKRRFLGFEIVPEYFAFANERLEKGLYRLPPRR